MKKQFLILASIILVIFLTALFLAIILSFKIVKQTTDKINLALKDDLQTIVRIPTPIPPETKSFDSTTYIWEMETNEGEITKVKFVHDTAFSKNNQNITATLEMVEGQDPSLFNKVLPAVITDKQTIISITDPKRINLGKNEQAGYEKIDIYNIEGRQGQISQVTWQLDKAKILNKNAQLYEKIYKYPLFLLKTLYYLQKFILTLFAS
jgi:hypothetical protein